MCLVFLLLCQLWNSGQISHQYVKHYNDQSMRIETLNWRLRDLYLFRLPSVHIVIICIV